jgi:hypothetical protein
MANANYTLTVGAMIDTIFVLEIGGQYANVNHLSGSLENVFLLDGSIHIRVELGGSIGADWDLKVEVQDDDGEYETVPASIKGKINPSGGSKFDRSCPLKSKQK